ncbi:MAG: V-type ATP synthase subunit F [Firmicutes bacterium]|nr:V-type ATP synthase subunit F [Bacillota bacterium]
MRYFAISADDDTLTGLRLAGIEGAVATAKRDVLALIESSRADETIAVLLITEPCYELCRDTIDTLKLSAMRPLISIIPPATGSWGDTGSITRLIREAIGVKI